MSYHPLKRLVCFASFDVACRALYLFAALACLALLCTTFRSVASALPDVTAAQTVEQLLSTIVRGRRILCQELYVLAVC